MPPESSELLQGTLEMLVLKALSLAPLHGWGIGHRIDQLSKDAFQIQQGSLYPALQRMLRKGWIKSEWRITENNRRARFYTISPSGRAALKSEVESWRRFAAAIEVALDAR